MRPRGVLLAAAGLALAVTAPAGALVLAGTAPGGAAHKPARCPHSGRPAIAADPKPHALRVFAIQFRQQPASIRTGNDYARAIDCAMRLEVAPYLARGRPNVVVFDEDIGIEVLATGSRAASARRLLKSGVPQCHGMPFPCATLAILAVLNGGYAQALNYLEARYPGLHNQLGRAFVAATDGFVRIFMGTMAREALRYHVYVVASNTQSPFRLTHDPK